MAPYSLRSCSPVVYLWLAPDNSLRIGWDNVPHHKHVATFPHHTSRRPTRYDKQATDEVRVESFAWFLHQSSRSLGFFIKHVGTRDTLRPSEETSLEDVLRVVLDMKSERS